MLVLVSGADVGGVDTTDVFGVVDGGVTEVTGLTDGVVLAGGLFDVT